mmetsp:Transcript_637/g.1445  ORF Transcript_637/g.1445 Transcript_637/m.1445 type:complete len:438 (+) Transcript_637:58-1371(+)|eukprot:CAMPEP_0171106738 /NCGR_PEP_ID=MMETSP0766_2-20121228/65397_1 /TAXON_ID=439317 /ORGANISM="Gambierdiscus australes, Strain CAWD 149" /LENGTH=437 /DNA_ID=CAMNT_0011567905 /DNA_START=57 /DNA_END=1370 /DNA_ORIENTATION=+
MKPNWCSEHLLLLLVGSSVEAVVWRKSAGHIAAPVSSEAGFWVCKNGNASRSGAAGFKSEVKLTEPVWRFKEEGHQIEATPVIDENFTTYVVSCAGRLHAILRNGTVAWTKQLNGRGMTPMLQGGLLYVGSAGAVACKIEAFTGKTVWCFKYAQNAGGDAWTTTVAGDVVIVAADDARTSGGNLRVVGLSEKDGSTLWSFKPRSFFWNLMPSVVGDAFYFSDSAGGLYLLGLADGKLRWEMSGQPHSQCTGGSILGPNGMLYASSNTEGMQHGHLRALNLETGLETWHQRFPVEASAAPAVGRVGQRLVVLEGAGENPGMTFPVWKEHNGSLVCFDATTGEKLWEFTAPSYRNFACAGYSLAIRESLPDTWSNPAIDAAGNVYIGWSGGWAFHLDGMTGKPVSQYYLGSAFQGAPALAPGLVIFPSINEVVAFGGLQ